MHASATPSALPSAPDLHRRETDRAPGISWCFVYGYCGLPAVRFFPEVRRLGGGFTKVYLFWQQLEPERGRFDGSAVEAFAGQLESPDQGLISLFSSSLWATRRASALLPPSRAKSLEDYYSVVFRLVRQARGRVRFFQNDAEPNNPVFWGGTQEEYVEQLRVFYRAVKDADPGAQVILGGHDGRFVPEGLDALPGQRTQPFPRQAEGLAFFEHLLRHAGDCFDYFDLRLYGDPYTIEARVAHVRALMRAAGCLRPVVCTEYGGPNFFEFPENRRYLPLVDAWSDQVAAGGPGAQPGPADRVSREIASLYDSAPSLAPQTQMFLQGCPPAWEAKLFRIQSRQLVIRNILARAAGVERTLYWQLPVLPGPRDDLMTLMYGKIGLLQWEEGHWREHGPMAGVFQRLARLLAGVRGVERVPHADRSVFLFRLDRDPAPEPAWIAWQRRDLFAGEDQPALACRVPCRPGTLTLTTTFGQVTVEEAAPDGIVIQCSDTPLWIEPRADAAGAKEITP